jgi:hypothetical protein
MLTRMPMIMTKHRHARWLLQHYWLVPICLAGGLWCAIQGLWISAVSFAVWALALVSYERASRWSYRRGYLNAMHDIGEAGRAAESLPEFTRLVLSVPEPWERD